MAAILFPVFARARENARRASCQSNLKQLGLGTMMYMQDYDETMFIFNYNIPGGTQHWAGQTIGSQLYPERGLLQPYMKNVQITDCPSAAGIPGNGVLSILAYAPNSAYLNPTYFVGGVAHHIPAKLSQIDAPAETVLMGDTGFLNGVTGNIQRISDFRPPFNTSASAAGIVESTTPTFPTVHARHLETANVLWMDGHVKAMRINYRTANQNANVTAQMLRNAHVGDLIKGARTGIPAEDNYYFRLNK
jgi:prepilin-type processing-associated H-X9-DG protein